MFLRVAVCPTSLVKVCYMQILYQRRIERERDQRPARSPAENTSCGLLHNQDQSSAFWRDAFPASGDYRSFCQ